MRKRFNIISIMIIFLGLINVYPLFSQTPAFPGAEGYGKYATGGRGGRVIEVTTVLDMDRYGKVYDGSLRKALSTEGTDPITIVFRVSGIIELKGELKSSRPNMTIAGQTAPGDGVCLKDYSVKFSGENLIIRYIRFRPGDEARAVTSCLNIENTRQIIIDHCSLSWSIEENMGFYDNDSTTVQYCILSESLRDSYHPKGERGYASQWGGQWASYHHNLIAHHRSRSPRFNGSHSNDYFAVQDFRNNVVYNYGHAGAIYGGENELFLDVDNDGENDAGSFINFVHNYMKPGPDYSGGTFMRPSLARADVDPQGYAEWYISDNYIHGYENITADNWSGVATSEVGSADNIRVDVEHEVSPITTATAEEAYDLVLNNSGAIKPTRDPVDIRIVNSVINGTGEIIDAVSEVGGWPTYNTPVEDSIPVDTDVDGIPDYWEDENGLDKNNVEDGKIITESGYSNLELYLNSDIPYIDPNSVGVFDKKDNLEKYEIKAYPNPATGFIIIKAEKTIKNVEVLSLDLKPLSTNIINDIKGEVQIEELPEGVYFVKANFLNGESSITKIIKK